MVNTTKHFSVCSNGCHWYVLRTLGPWPIIITGGLVAYKILLIVLSRYHSRINRSKLRDEIKYNNYYCGSQKSNSAGGAHDYNSGARYSKADTTCGRLFATSLLRGSIHYALRLTTCDYPLVGPLYGWKSEHKYFRHWNCLFPKTVSLA